MVSSTLKVVEWFTIHNTTIKNKGEHMDVSKLLKKIEKIKVLVSSVSKSVHNLQWELDRMGSGGQIEYKRLERETTELEKLCK